MEAVRGEPGDGGHGVGFVGGLEQEDASRFEDAGDVAEDGQRFGQVFEDVVGEDPIKGGVGPENTAGVGDLYSQKNEVRQGVIGVKSLDCRNLIAQY